MNRNMNGNQQENWINQPIDSDSDSDSFSDSDDSDFLQFNDQEQDSSAPGALRAIPIQLNYIPYLHDDDPRQLLEEGRPLVVKINLDNRNQLWMGNVETYMIVSFIASAFEKMGEYPKSVKLMIDIFSNESAGYAYVDFYDPESTMTRLNGKIIPNTHPPVEFNLDRLMKKKKLFYRIENHVISGENHFIKLSEIDPNVNNFMLYKAFASRYQSVISAFVDSISYSKKYGFVSFGSIKDYKHCLLHMNNLCYPTIGIKPLKIKSISTFEYEKAINDSNSYNKTLTYGDTHKINYSQRYNMACGRPIHLQCSPEPETTVNTMIVKTEENSTIIDNKKEIDVDALNKESVSQDGNLRDALESSEWLPYISLDEFE